MVSKLNTDGLIAEIDQLASTAISKEQLMAAIVQLLGKRLPKFNWVGFYMLEKPELGVDPVLVLGPFIGAPTPHVRIPLNQGICGAAASTGETVVIDDVNSDPRYLACSIETMSEIVVPIYVSGEVVGEIDIDSHERAAFGPLERKIVEHCAIVVGRYLEENSA